MTDNKTAMWVKPNYLRQKMDYLFLIKERKHKQTEKKTGNEISENMEQNG